MRIQLLVLSLLGMTSTGVFAQASTTKVHLFTASAFTRQIEYSANVNSDCTFDSGNPFLVIVTPEGEPSHKMTGIESSYVALDYTSKTPQSLKAEVRVFKNNNISYPVTVTLGTDSSGKCQSMVVSPEGTEIIQSVQVVDARNMVPTKILVAALVNGQPKSISLNF